MSIQGDKLLSRNKLMALHKQEGLWQRVHEVLKNPRIDKTIAIVAILPFAYVVYTLLQGGKLNIPRAVVAIHYSLIVITMLIRTTPVRITPNPWFWLLAFVGTYWGFCIAAFAQRGVALVPVAFANSLSILSVAIHVYARISLGRSMGFVPAQRVIVTKGAYRFVRHPIYAGTLLALFSFALRSFTPLNAVLAFAGASFLIVKCLIEESFLKGDPEYAVYLKRVRWRWIPGLV
jgi:protein-S-isoprenylcysteine O-methyltransferase Ste14